MQVHKIAAMLTMITCSLFSQMKSIPGNTFTVGNNNGDPDESPETTIAISSFTIDEKEVTQKEYDSCVQAGVCTPPHYQDKKCILWSSSGLKKVTMPKQFLAPNRPVVCVTWYQARQYCRYKKKRLPTELEWEYAAKAGTSSTYAWGNEPPNETNTSRNTPYPQSVKMFRPNTWGLYDMTGNVWEWVDDRYQVDRYTFLSDSTQNPPSVGRYRSIRGGGWYSTPSQLRITNRQWFTPEYGEVSIGFRCAQ